MHILGVVWESDKTCSYGDDVEFFVAAVLELDTCLGELGNRVVLDVDDINIGPVELLVVVLLQTGPLYAEEVRHLQWCQDVPLPGVANSISYMLGPEIVCFLVGISIYQHVLVVANPEAESSVVPQLVVKCLTIFWGIIECILLIQSVEESTKALFAVFEKAVVPLLSEILFFWGEHALLHRDCQIGCPLVHFHLADFGSPFLGNLNPRGARANYRATLSLNVDTFLGPERRMVNDPLELIKAFEGWDVALGCLQM